MVSIAKRLCEMIRLRSLFFRLLLLTGRRGMGWELEGKRKGENNMWSRSHFVDNRHREWFCVILRSLSFARSIYILTETHAPIRTASRRAYFQIQIMNGTFRVENMYLKLFDTSNTFNEKLPTVLLVFVFQFPGQRHKCVSLLSVQQWSTSVSLNVE